MASVLSGFLLYFLPNMGIFLQTVECSTASSTWELPGLNPVFLPTCMRKSEGNREPWVGLSSCHFDQVTEMHFLRASATPCRSLQPTLMNAQATFVALGPKFCPLGFHTSLQWLPPTTWCNTTWSLHSMKFKASFRSCEIIQWPTFYVCEKFDKTSAPIVCPRKEE